MKSETKIKKFVDCHINIQACNFKCPYCYLTHRGLQSNHIVHLKHSAEEIRYALSKKKLGGGVSLINLCASGETLLSPDVILIAKALLEEGHFVMIVTNGSLTKQFEKIRDTFSEVEKKHLFFKFSFHYFELKRLGLLETFFENIKMMRNEGCSFTVELTPHDEIISDIQQIKKICKEKLGALCHITVARDERTGGIDHLSKLNWEEYKKTWSQFDSELFDFKKLTFYNKRKEFCYAGDWALFVDLDSGVYSPCNCGKNLGNIYDHDKLKLCAIGKCELPHCYNAHVWLAFNCIPRFTKTTFSNERDRVDNKGIHWLTEEFQEVFSCKLDESNAEYKSIRKIFILICARLRKTKIKIGNAYRTLMKRKVIRINN